MDSRIILVLGASLLLLFSKQQFFQSQNQQLQAATVHPTQSPSIGGTREASSSSTIKSTTKTSAQVKQLPAKHQVLAPKASHHDEDKLAALQTQLDLQQEQLATLTQDLRTLEKTWAFEDWEFKHWWEQLTHVSTQATFSGALPLSTPVNTSNWWQACLAWFDEQLGVLNWRVPQFFHDQVTFAHQVNFTDMTTFERLQMSEHSAGQLVLESGELIFTHHFATAYQQPPLVFLSPVGQSSDYPYYLSVSKSGFTLELYQSADIPLSWQWLVIDTTSMTQEF